MEYQLKMPFPSNMMDQVKEKYKEIYVQALENKVAQLKRSVAAYKGHFTKQQKRNNHTPNT